MNNSYRKLEKVINNGGIVIMPSDTIYGMMASALDCDAVEKLYRVRGRDTKKACIILIASIDELDLFDVHVNDAEREQLKELWKKTTSIVLPCPQKKWSYLHRGQKTLAFRLIGKRHRVLRSMLRNTGPVIAPSANPEGKKVAETIREAKAYYGDNVDLYVSAGRRVIGRPSRVVRIDHGKLTWLRK